MCMYAQWLDCCDRLLMWARPDQSTGAVLSMNMQDRLKSPSVPSGTSNVQAPLLAAPNLRTWHVVVGTAAPSLLGQAYMYPLSPPPNPEVLP
jgi:hypothetical protein